jgi:hypothetical protein
MIRNAQNGDLGEFDALAGGTQNLIRKSNESDSHTCFSQRRGTRVSILRLLACVGTEKRVRYMFVTASEISRIPEHTVHRSPLMAANNVETPIFIDSSEV